MTGDRRGKRGDLTLEAANWRFRSLSKSGNTAGFAAASSTDTSKTAPGDTESATGVKRKPCRPRMDRMPPWKVLLHNDDRNEAGFVIEVIVELTTLNPHAALIKMLEAHKTGVALLLTVHREYAELLQEQFTSKGLTVTIEADC